MQKILFATTVFDDVENGPGTYAQYLWDAFRDDDEIEFHLVAPKSQLIHPHLHISGSPSGSLNLYKAIQDKIVKLQQEYGPFTVLHANNAHMLGGFRCDGLPIIAQVNDYEVAESFVKPLATIKSKGFKRSMSLAWRKYHEERVLKNCAMVVTNSNYVKNKICESYGLQEQLCRSVYKAVNLAVFRRNTAVQTELINEDTSGSRCLRIIFIGSNWEIKGLDYLLAAMKILIAKELPVKLVVIGGGTHPQNQVIRNRFADLEAAGTVSYLGRKSRDEIPKLLWQSDISVLPSRQEALGVSILESMAAGVPVVAARVGGIPEILAGGQYGIECEPDNVIDLASAIESLIKSQSLRLKYIQEGYQRVELFSKNVMIEKIRQIYSSFDSFS